MSNSLAITINFSKSNYVIREIDGLVKPMLILSNPSSTDITIGVSTVGMEAIGEYYLMYIEKAA